jgi:hypothetical protein
MKQVMEEQEEANQEAKGREWKDKGSQKELREGGARGSIFSSEFGSKRPS